MRPDCANANSADTRRRGYTLLEVLVTLAILVTIAALSWPKLMHWLDDRKLEESAESVRTTLAKGRIWAIDNSLTYQFRFEPNGRFFIVLSHELEFSRSEAQAEAAADRMSPKRMVSGELPEGIEFKSLTAAASVEQLSSDRLAGLPNADKLSQVRWSSPILFYADGTATDSTVLMTDERENEFRIDVRGLTGAATAKEGGLEEDSL